MLFWCSLVFLSYVPRYLLDLGGGLPRICHRLSLMILLCHCHIIVLPLPSLTIIDGTIPYTMIDIEKEAAESRMEGCDVQ